MNKSLLTSTAHILPFDKLDALTFERLSLWLVKAKGYLRPEHYGLGGTEQGRDIIAYLKTGNIEDLWYFQCKRYKEIDASTLKKEVDKIGNLATVMPTLKPVGIVFIIQCAVSAKIRDEVKHYCDRSGMKCEFWAHTELDMYVKEYPLIVQEFFIPSNKFLSTNSTEQSLAIGGITTTSLKTANDLYSSLPTDTIPGLTDLPPGSRMVISHNPLFIGREAYLIAIAKSIYSGTYGQTVAITGLGGLGKTQLACEFAHTYGQYFAGGVFWINFENPEAIPSEIAACGVARHLNLRHDFDFLPLDAKVDLVLTAWDSPLPRLLIFDNCDDEVLLTKWRRITGGCKTIITSRRTEWSATLGVNVLPLDRLDREDSVLLIEKYSPDAYDDKAILSGIADNLGDLPLALHLAGSFLARYRNSINPVTYLSQLSRPGLLQHQSLQGRGLRRETSPTFHEQHVARTFALSYERLNTNDPVDALAIKMLVRAAHLAQDTPIHQELLWGISDIDAEDAEGLLQAEDSLHRLLELGLLEKAPETAFRLHRLLAAFARDTVSDESARAAVEQSIIDIADFWNNVGHANPLLLIQTHLRAVTDSAVPREDDTSANLCRVLGVHLFLAGDYKSAHDYLNKALSIFEKLKGETSIEVGGVLSHLGMISRQLKQLDESRTYYTRALDIAQHAATDNSSSLVAVLNNLGSLLIDEGKYQDALDLHKKALAIFEEQHDKNALFKASLLNNVGLALHHVRLLNEALTYYEQALEIRKKHLGEYHQRTAEVINNIGGLYSHQGERNKAKEYYSKALELYRVVLHENHPDIARTLLNLAIEYEEDNKYELATQYCEEALDIYNNNFGSEHPDTVHAVLVLTNLLLQQEELGKARSFFPQLLSGSLGLHKLYATAFLKGLTETSFLLLDQGEPSLAESFRLKALEVIDTSEALDTSTTAVALMFLAMGYRNVGEHKKAIGLFKRAFSQFGQGSEYYHPVVAHDLNYVADTLMEQGDFLEAQSYYERAIDIYESTSTIDKEYTAALNNLATLLREEGKFDEAKKLYEKSITVLEQNAATHSPEYVKTLNNLAVVHRRQRDYKSAKSLISKALNMAEKISIVESEHIALCIHNLACVAYHEGDYHAAVDLSRRAISIYEKTLGHHHPHTRLTYENLQHASKQLLITQMRNKGRSRNAACHCGSGKKFKKCCGAA
ncbi:MAG: tetratricopeptide repeat protein [Acidobacteriota bacterium]|nr:tetratricopeptide repeat protein [Acidobacteriota bacterium]